MKEARKEQTVGIGMSGGTDSTAAAMLLLEAGYDVVGYTMLTTDDSEAVVAKATAVADKLGIEHRTVDLRDSFKCNVLDALVEGYANGLTPSPCVICNRKLKFGALRERMLADGCDFAATGHYARLTRDDAGHIQLRRGIDKTKDQSYFLAQLTSEQLETVVFPLGDRLKGELKEKVKSLGLVPKEEAESQDLCFVPNGGIGDFVAERRPALRHDGWIVDPTGRRLGRHDGAFQYTPGQRRGLGLGGGPWFVIRTDMATNTVVVGHREELGVTTLRVNGMNWLIEPKWPVACVAQVRYLMKPCEALVHPDGIVTFTEPLEAAPPGQLCVFYDGDQVLGSGWIA
ncbi:MAG: tRNA 2-thiouridine(34) synthase MnmA [Victivallales bacterium]|nr:tRNA 2-thiouridine(34) synthase MnmA [Victivallales bacterium]